MPLTNPAGFAVFSKKVAPRPKAKKAKIIAIAPYLNQHWRKVMAIGCTHGILANDEVKKQILAFKDRYKPSFIFDLGDIVDTAAFRNGARGTADEAMRPEPDIEVATKWIEDLGATHITWGNHDARLLDLQKSPNAIIAYAASELWKSLNSAAKKIHAKTKDYDFETGWFEVGGCFWGHGVWYGEHALRDHAEFLGGSVVMAHLHAPSMTEGRTRKWSPSYCVGTLADIPKMFYSRRRRATSRWGHGCVIGEVSDKSSHLHLVSSEKGEPLRFPL